MILTSYDFKFNMNCLPKEQNIFGLLSDDGDQWKFLVSSIIVNDEPFLTVGAYGKNIISLPLSKVIDNIGSPYYNIELRFNRDDKKDSTYEVVCRVIRQPKNGVGDMYSDTSTEVVNDIGDMTIDKTTISKSLIMFDNIVYTNVRLKDVVLVKSFDSAEIAKLLDEKSTAKNASLIQHQTVECLSCGHEYDLETTKLSFVEDIDKCVCPKCQHVGAKKAKIVVEGATGASAIVDPVNIGRHKLPSSWVALTKAIAQKSGGSIGKIENHFSEKGKEW